MGKRWWRGGEAFGVRGAPGSQCWCAPPDRGCVRSPDEDASLRPTNGTRIGMTTSGEPFTPRTLDCELCIVGAGYAALNGLNAAAKYLKKGARVVLIDKNETWGGQWLRQYDFVRLHQ